MSDSPQDIPDEPKPPATGGFGRFSINDANIGIIRRPENAHLDQQDQEKPAE